jgi:hypothetical protein
MRDLITEEWRAQREELRAELFGSSVEDLACLAGLSRQVKKYANVGRASAVPNLEETSEMTDVVLEAFLLYGGSDVAREFGVSPDYQDAIQRMSAMAILTWERVCYIQGAASPFSEAPKEDIRRSDFDRKDVRLIVETASAFGENVSYVVSGRSGKISESAEGALTKLTARYGPQFARRWLSGDEARAVDPSLELNAAQLQNLARNNDLQGALEGLVLNIKKLSYDDIARELGIDPEEAEDYYSPSLVKHYAFTHRKDPMARLISDWKRYKDCTPEKLAESFGVRLYEVVDFFSPGYVLETIIKYPNKYMTKLQQTFENAKLLTAGNLAAEWGVSKKAIDEVLPHYVRNEFATHLDSVRELKVVFDRAIRARQETGLNIRALVILAANQRTQFEELIPKLVEARESPPSGISPNLWVSAVAKAPYDPEQQKKIATAYRLYKDALTTHGGTGIRERSEVDSRLSGQPTEDIVLGDEDPLHALPRLAESGGVDKEQLRNLLKYYENNPDATSMPADMAEVLKRLQTAAKTEIES